jgi:hypothetical protein
MIKEDYNEDLALKKERVNLLNQTQLVHLEEIEKDREEQMASRFKKYNVLEYIRSKYQY